jgi:LuxR family transcriptional regulator, regulator of acetate metabolism
MPLDVRERLTTRERAVLATSAAGLVVAEVAVVLGLAPEVVRDALRSAIAKLQARTKIEAVVVALRRGLIVASS